MDDYPELRAYLASQENFEAYMRKNAYLCVIRDKQAISPVKALEFNNKIQPSTIVVTLPNGEYQEFWYEVYIHQENIPYEERLASYSEYFLVY